MHKESPFEAAIMDMLGRAIMESICQKGNTGKLAGKPTPIFRVEMPTGRGPFNSGLPEQKEIYEKLAGDFDCVKLADPDHNCELMGITEKAFKDKHGHAAYGCDSLKAVNDWFSLKARKYLAKFGAKIVEYEVPATGYIAPTGHGEVIFNRAECKRVRELDVVEGCKP